MKPKLYNVYECDRELWVVINNSDIHDIQMHLVNCEGEWLACFDENCPMTDVRDLQLKINIIK